MVGSLTATQRVWPDTRKKKRKKKRTEKKKRYRAFGPNYINYTLVSPPGGKSWVGAGPGLPWSTTLVYYPGPHYQPSLITHLRSIKAGAKKLEACWQNGLHGALTCSSPTAAPFFQPPTRWTASLARLHASRPGWLLGHLALYRCHPQAKAMMLTLRCTTAHGCDVRGGGMRNTKRMNDKTLRNLAGN
jgi:hypothetical protein